MSDWTFSPTFMTWLVYVCLGLTVISAGLLVGLLIRDWSAGRLW